MRVLDDAHREAPGPGVVVDGVRVTADGSSDVGDGTSRGVRDAVEVASPEPAAAVEALLARVDEVAEVPRALRAGAPVHRDAARG